MKRLLIFLSVLVAVIVAAAVALPFVISPQFVSSQITAAVKKQTGRTLKINGPLRFSFWPDLAVEANDVILSNPPGMDKGQVAAIRTLRIRLAARPLLAREVNIREMTLIAPRLSLVIDTAGRANWNFAGPAGSENKPAGSTSPDGSTTVTSFNRVRLAPLKITNGDVRFLDERSGAVFAATSVNMTISMPQFPGPATLKGHLVWNGDRIAINASLKDPPAISGRGTPADLSVIASRLNLQFSGLARLKDGLQLAGTMEASTRSIRELAKWTGNPLQPGKGLGPFSARAGLDLTPRTIKLSKAKISLDGMNAQGSLSVKLGGRRPAITASIGMDQINVNTYLAAPSNAPAASTPATSEWSNRPIDFSGLKAVDANLSIATSQIVYRDVKIGTTRLTATLMGGVLKAKLKEMAFYDGKANGVLVLNGARTRPVIQGALNATGLNGFRLLRDFAKFKRLEGTAQLRLSLAATGRSQRELVSTLAGKAAFRFTNGAIRGINIAAMIRNVQKSILGGWDKSGNRNTDFSVLSASFVFKDGIGRNDDLQMLGPLVRLTGKGEVDMLSRRINYRTEPKLVATLKGQGGKTELSGLAVPVIIKGPWAKPKIYPDIKGILSNPQAAYDKLRQLIGKGKGIDLKAQKKKLTGKLSKKAGKIVDDTLGNTVDEQTRTSIKKKGRKLLRGLFGKKKKPAVQPQ